jgi:formate hydrogenlyase transcriptional activator
MSNTNVFRRPDWRTTLNRAVRQCAASLDAADDQAASAAIASMLAEMGETLGIDCVTLVECWGHSTTGHDWKRSPATPDGQAIDVSVLLNVIRPHAVDCAPVVIDEQHAERFPGARTLLRRASLRSAVIARAGIGLQPTCVWAFGTERADPDWSDPLLEHLQLLGDIVAGALQRRARKERISAAIPAITPAARPQPMSMNRRPADIVGDSPALRAALERMEQVASTTSTVLLLGETGTGKELFARALHTGGPRRGAPMVSVNCGALPPTLIESELFGHQRGAFTGAVAPRQGRFELAHRGTLFLDEIGDLPLDLQAKLLRVLQEGTFERLGSSSSQAVDVRIVAATHQDLMHRVSTGAFRADLFYRLNVFPIRLPSLRERIEDIPALVWSFIRKRQGALHRCITNVSENVMAILQRYTWPGNIRELENVVERALIHSAGDTLMLDGSPAGDENPPPPGDGTTLVSVERTHIQEVLRNCGWRINGLGNAAERLGMHPNTLRFRMKKLGIVRHESIRQRRSDDAAAANMRRHAC